MRSSPCRSCAAPILWVRTSKGKLMPLDAEPCADGNMVVVDGVAFTAYTLDFEQDRPRYRSHYATCPQAKEWRKSRSSP